MTTGACDSIIAMTLASDIGSDDLDTLRAELAAEQLARREAEARASGAEAMVAHLKLMIAKLRHDQYGASSERSRKLVDQMELELEELEASAAEDAAAVALRWTRKFGQEIKLGLLLRRTDLNDGQTEAVFGGFQGEGCS